MKRGELKTVRYRTVADIFSQVSKVYDRFLSLATAGRIHSWQNELIAQLSKEGNWLDVGTGTGEILKKLKSSHRGILVGIDPAFGMLRIAKSKCPECYFVQALGESLPFRDRTFTSLSLSLVFRHLQDKLSFLEEAHRVLKEGGRIGIVDIGKFRGTGLLLFLMRTVLRPLGIVVFGGEKWNFFIHSVEESYTLEEVVGMLETKGFRVDYTNRRLLGVIHIVVATKTA
jgi:demethylmenaquinone methyltransferase/2-methoxy-6-polyprenyl-1,4-benzoquinol methylase